MRRRDVYRWRRDTLTRPARPWPLWARLALLAVAMYVVLRLAGVL